MIGDQPERSNVDGSGLSKDDGFYVFSASDGESKTLPLMIKNKPVNVIIDSVATSNLMSEQLFDKVSKGNIELLKTDRKGYPNSSRQRLKVSGKCMLSRHVAR